MVRFAFLEWLLLPPKKPKNMINSTYPGFKDNVATRYKSHYAAAADTYQKGLLQDQIYDSEVFPSVLGGVCFVRVVGRSLQFHLKHMKHLAFMCATGASLANKCPHEGWYVSYSIFQSRSEGGMKHIRVDT